MKLFKSGLIAAGIVAVSVIAGCVAYKPPPSIIHGDNYTAEQDANQTVVPPASRVLSLEEAIRIGLTNNPTYKQKYLAVLTAWTTLYGDLGLFSPVISASYGGTQTPKAAGAAGSGGNNSRNSPSWTGNLAGTWNVFNGLQDTMTILQGRITALQAEELERDWRRTLIQAIILAYNTILNARADIQIQLANESYNQIMARDTSLKYDAGASSLSEVLNWKIKENQARDLVITKTAVYQTDRYALAVLLGLTSGNLPVNTQFPPLDVPENAEYNMGVEFYLDMAISQRPDLKASKLGVEGLKYALYNSWGAFSPTIDLDANYGFNRTSRTNNSIWGSSVPRGQDQNFNYGFNANWVLWQGGARIANVRNAQIAVDNAEESLLSKYIDVVQSVRTAYTNLLQANAHRKITNVILSQTSQRRNLLTEEYNAGNVDIATLNQAQQDLVGAENAHVQAVIGVSNNRANLSAAAGITNY